MNKKLDILNKGFGVSIILINIPLLFLSIKIITTSGGPWGYGLLVLPITLVSHVFIYSAYQTLNLKVCSNRNFVLNVMGFIYCVGVLYLYLTS